MAMQLERVGHHVMEIYSRDMERAQAFASLFYTVVPQDHLDFTDSGADIFMLCLPDDALDKVLPYLQVPPDSIVVHTAGSRSLEVLQGYDFAPGVFYPLQSLTKGKAIDFSDVPLLIEAEDEDTTTRLLKLASTLSKRVEVISSDERAVLHVAAVFASNFSNHMLHLASNIVEAEGLPFNLLHSLIVETVNKSLAIGPGAAQTGPAIRGDVKTIDKHLDYLAPNPDLWRLYQLLSQSIVANR